ncbi:MAG: hypothetical protein K5654_09135 [Lachnospiraceae bacterium]|nr:hypothetical protein [Lachnospiraceae bacterium]
MQDTRIKIQLDYDESYNRLRKRLISTIVSLIIVYSFTTIIQSKIDIFSINKIVGGTLAFLSVILFCIKPKPSAFLGIFYFIINALISIITSKRISIEINDFVYLFATLLMLVTISNEKNIELFLDALKKRRKIIIIFVILECIILLYLLITKTGYSYHWGEGRYFHGMCNSQHTMASDACLIISFLVFLAKTDKRYIRYGLLAIIPAYAIFETGARVFLIPLAILTVYLIQNKFRKRFARIIIYIIGIVVSAYIMVNSAMMDKFSFVINNPYAINQMSGFTSGRTEFWKEDIKLFISGSPIQILFGRTFWDVYSTNFLKVRMEIWAHNDLIHLLIGTGLVGASIYTLFICYSLFSVRDKINNKTTYIMLIIYVVLPLFFNGFFLYQHFLYSFVVLLFAIVLTKDGSTT